jgi:hypothetical protein
MMDLASEPYGALVEAVPLKLRKPSDNSPLLARRDQEVALHGKSFEEANWAKLSPTFRETHNRLRQVHGLEPIPPPVIDLYVPPKARKIEKFDPNDREFLSTAREFLRMDVKLPTIRHKNGEWDEGFTVNGQQVKF